MGFPILVRWHLYIESGPWYAKLNIYHTWTLGGVRLLPTGITRVKFLDSTTSGARFNIKMWSYQYRKSHCGDKTVVRSSYLHNGISYTGKMASLYWFSPLFIFSMRLSVICVLTLSITGIILQHHIIFAEVSVTAYVKHFIRSIMEKLVNVSFTNWYTLGICCAYIIKSIVFCWWWSSIRDLSSTAIQLQTPLRLGRGWVITSPTAKFINILNFDLREPLSQKIYNYAFSDCKNGNLCGVFA